MNITTSFPKALAISMLLFLAAIASMTAATFTVTNTADTGLGSLRQAVLNANASTEADTIVFQSAVFSSPQTITLATEIAISSNANTVDTLTIIGPGANLLTVSGNGVSRIFRMIANDTTSISGMTLPNGAGSDGGAIQTAGIVTLTNMNFVENVANSGGAIFNSGNGTTSGVLTIRGCAFTNNQTTGTNINGDGGSALETINGLVNISDSTVTGGRTRGGGGAIRSSGTMNISNTTISNNTSGGVGNTNGGGAIFNIGSLTLTNCIVSGNVAGEDTDGGAITNAGNLTLISSTVTANTATRYGGGVYTASSGTANITRSTISANTAEGYAGGGLYFRAGSGAATVSGSSVSGNFADVPGAGGLNYGGGEGGGIWSGTALTIENSTISTNAADGNGGGIFGAGGSLVLSGVTVVGNWGSENSSESTGGIYNRATSIIIRNNIVANNWGFAGKDVRGHFHSEGYNLIEDTLQWQGYHASISGDTATNIIGLDPNLGPLADNGGPTHTHALLSGSPAIDKGNSFGTTTDQRGFTRPFDFASIANASGGDGADIGAYEVDPTPPVLVSARSEMTHGDAGTFGVDLPLSNSLGVESRRGTGSDAGRNYTIVLRFNRPITGGTATMNGTGSVGTVSINGREMIVPLTGVVDVQVVTVNAFNITTQDGGTLQSTSVQIGFLIGDVNGNGAVNVGDALLAKNRSGQTTNATNFRTDVNPDGVINTGDALIVRGRSGNFLP